MDVHSSLTVSLPCAVTYISFIISKTALLDPWFSLEYSAKIFYPHAMCSELDHPIFTSIDFAKIFFLQNIFVLNLEDQVILFMFLSEWMAQLHLQGTGFPNRLLLLIAGLHWRYSNQPSYGITHLVLMFVVLLRYVVGFWGPNILISSWHLGYSSAGK